jgi:hypothetical protein
MRITHTLSVHAKCPKDGMPDRYVCVVRTDTVIPVEDILDVAKACGELTIFQEDLCQLLHRKINACVTLIGYHSGV